MNPILSMSRPVLLTIWLAGIAWSQRDLREIPDPSPELQQASFEVAEGFAINLFATDPMIAKPVQMNWDAEGRLWLVSSRVYPHLKPGQEADDEILVIEDTDGDGEADRKTVFADGLLIPTGLIPADGGVYVANSTEILFMEDTDGDGRADRRKILFSGFGTEDTHHLIHTFRGGPEGMIYFNQSIYIHSHVETPWGVRRLLGGGVWHFRPETRRLEVFCKGFVNPWGHAIDSWGQSFVTDGAYGEGINYVFPGSVWVTSPGATRILKGLNPGQPKHCSLTILSGRHLPESVRGQLVTNDFRGHRVNRFELSEDGSGYASRQVGDLIRSTHGAFRPIDVQMGPDGAIYIADWYNPIIQHGEVDFRDPRRDHTRGRIWRITAKGRPMLQRPKIVRASPDVLLELLKSPEDWTRYFAKSELKRLGPEKVRPSLERWLERLDAEAIDPQREHHRLEALWVYQHLNEEPPALLDELLRSGDHRVRAAAVRSIYHWHESMPHALSRLREAIEDRHPRVRLEAVNALRRLRTKEAFVAAMRALDQPMDENLDFALWLTARELEEAWLPEFQAGTLVLGGAGPTQFALRAIENPEALRPLITAFVEGQLSGRNAEESLDVISELGGSEDLGAVAAAIFGDRLPPALRVAGLKALVDAGRERGIRPDGDLEGLDIWLSSENAERQALAAEAVGLWQLEAYRSRLTALAEETLSVELVRAIYSGLASLGGTASVEILTAAAAEPTTPPGKRVEAVRALVRIDVMAGAEQAAKLLSQSADSSGLEDLFASFLGRKEGPEALAAALSGKTIPTPIAYLGLQRASASGHESADTLIGALSKAGNLSSITESLSEAELGKLIDEVNAQGDAHRGESVYRQQALQCQVCHALGGAGGQLGPDLISIGSSAPVDYIIDSLLVPSKKVKEGYHMTVVTTQNDEVLSGYIPLEDDRQLLIRDLTGKDTVVQKAMIVNREISPVSMMPPGLTGNLRRDEFIHLVKFLSELGKEGEFRIGPERVVRRWRVLAFHDSIEEAVRKGDQRFFAEPDDLKQWVPAYSTVAGVLPLDEIPSAKRWLLRVAPVQFEVEVSQAGAVRFRVNATDGLRFWSGVTEHVASEDGLFEVSLDPGRKVITLVIDPDAFPADELRVELLDVAGSEANVQLVGGI